MLRITLVKTARRRRLILEGELSSPWVAELRKQWNMVRNSSDTTPVVVDLRDVVTISQEAKGVLLGMICDGARFICGGVFNRHVIQQLARKASS